MFVEEAWEFCTTDAPSATNMYEMRVWNDKNTVSQLRNTTDKK